MKTEATTSLTPGDDCNVYVRSQRAGERVMEGLRKVYASLKLRVNEAKSAVAPVNRRQFLGFSFHHTAKLRVSGKAMQAFKVRIRQITRRNRGRSVVQVVEDLQVYLRGWKGYFRLSETPRVFLGLDQWLRRRLRVLHLKHWKTGKTTYRALRRLGASHEAAKDIAGHSGHWWSSSAGALNRVMTNAYFDRLGVPRLA